MTARRTTEALVIVACYLALRELSGELARQQAAHWFGQHLTAFYLPWAVVLAVTGSVWRPPRVIPTRDVWTRVNVLVFVGVVVATECLYGFMVSRLIAGDLALHPPSYVPGLFTAAVAAPMVEEWLFRGVLWDALIERTNTPITFVVTSLLFGVWHWSSLLEPSWYGNGTTPLYVHALFGAVMAAARWRLGAIGGCIVLHGLYNGLSNLSG